MHMNGPAYLSLIDTDTTGNRNDVTPLFADATALGQLAHDLAAPFADSRIECVGCIDALGFILGTAIACRLETGVLAIRKGGKLPVTTDSIAFTDYSGTVKHLEIRRDAIRPGMRVLVVDEWIETGAQVEAAASLVEGQEGIVAGIATIRIDRCERTESLMKRFDVHSVWPD